MTLSLYGGGTKEVPTPLSLAGRGIGGEGATCNRIHTNSAFANNIFILANIL